METCSALIGNGDVYLKKTTAGDVIDLSFAGNVIIDNLKITRTSTSNIGIYAYPVSNSTINNTDLYNLYAGIQVQE